MNKDLLIKHLLVFKEKLSAESARTISDQIERQERIAYYQGYSRERLLKMTKDDLLEYLSKLWAMLLWGNKEYYVGKLIKDNGFESLKKELSSLIWDEKPIEERWDRSRKTMKGIGPAICSELLCHTHPEKFILWNRRAFVGLNYLGQKDLPRYNYQLNGVKYKELCNIGNVIANEMKSQGLSDYSMLAVDYFLWDELQVVDNLSTINKKIEKESSVEKLSNEDSKFVHNEIRDAIRDIGEWLGFKSEIEKKVADGSIVDTVWESQIGNMGRVLYVFEVQTKGSKDSLILNLLKSRNNPAVQGVVAVSDRKQINLIKKHAADVPGLGEKLKFWDYEEVLLVHESLQFVNESINQLKLVPEGF